MSTSHIVVVSIIVAVVVAIAVVSRRKSKGGAPVGRNAGGDRFKERD